MAYIDLGTFDLFRRTIVTFYVLLEQVKIDSFALSSSNKQVLLANPITLVYAYPGSRLSVET